MEQPILNAPVDRPVGALENTDKRSTFVAVVIPNVRLVGYYEQDPSDPTIILRKPEQKTLTTRSDRHNQARRDRGVRVQSILQALLNDHFSPAARKEAVVSPRTHAHGYVWVLTDYELPLIKGMPDRLKDPRDFTSGEEKELEEAAKEGRIIPVNPSELWNEKEKFKNWYFDSHTQSVKLQARVAELELELKRLKGEMSEDRS